jgi:hypothetical protein
MPVAPAYMGGGYGNNGGFGGFGGDWGWIILLLLCANGGWGGFGGFGGMGGFGGAMWDFPWLINGQQGINNNVSDGFRDAQLHDSVTSVRDGVSALATQLCNCCGDMQMSIANSTAGIQNSLCSGFAGTTAAITGAQNAISNQLYNNEIASLNRSFAEQTANTAGFNGVQSGLCDIRYGNANNTRDILTALTAGVQSIKDQLCQDKIDAKNDEIAQLRQEILYTRGQAAAESIYQRGQNSQDVQTAQILAGQAAIPGQVYTRLSECPVNTVPVYGRQPIFQCNNGCGCGCGNNF